MSPLGWLDVSDLPFNVLLLLEPMHVQYIASREPDGRLGTALKAHPAVRWYLEQTHPPIHDYIQACLSLGKEQPSAQELRSSEIAVLDSMHDWLIYVLDPEKYDQLAFLNWNDTSLLEMADFKDKVVMDIGSGTGRLAFIAAPYATVVYAVEPVANLRRYLWNKRRKLGLNNVYPIDGSITQIPFPQDFADIAMAGHVFGENCEEEYQEMVRVVRDGGLILLHPGTNNSSEDAVHDFLIDHGFSYGTFEEPGDGIKRKYWKTIHKKE